MAAHSGTVRSPGRPAADPKLVARGIALVRKGLSPKAAAEELGGAISWRTLYRALQKLPESKRRPSARTVIARKRAAAAKAAQAAAEATVDEPMPSELQGIQADLWLYDRRIAKLQRLVDRMHLEAVTTGRTHGIASTEKTLAELIRRRAEIRPPPPPTTADEERRWRADADAVLTKIHLGVKAAELRTKGLIRDALAEWPDGARAAELVIAKLYGSEAA